MASATPTFDLLPDYPKAEISYKPEPLIYDDRSELRILVFLKLRLIAIFISVKYGKEANVLTYVLMLVCSTTDIRLLFYLSKWNHYD